MPPIRNYPIKPTKTERTHEENQERAYIAASRRSDRSLEARVESARRASEIHKRRTGRSLRVTEQDVINEEMYEEEDDDLPSQYRRLTAHLNLGGGASDMNRRLAAYITNNVAMRQALAEAMSGNFQQHFPNAPQFAHNQSMFPSPLMTQGFAPQQQPMQSPNAISPNSPHPYRQTPYPMPGSTQYRPNQQPRAMSIQMPPQAFQTPQNMTPVPSTPGAHLVSQQNTNSFRRASMPGPTGMNLSPEQGPQQLPSPRSETSPRTSNNVVFGTSKPGSAPASVANGSASQSPLQLHQPQPQHPPQQLSQQSHLFNAAQQQHRPQAQQQQQQQFQRQPRPQSLNIPNDNLAPFTMSLAPNDAAIVNPAALSSNDFSSALFGNNFSFDPSAGFDPSFSASDTGSMLKQGANFHPNVIGMNTTLAPAATYGSGSYDTNGTGMINMANFGTPGSNSDMQNLFDFGPGSSGPSGAGTPNGNDGGASFSEFADQGTWDLGT